MTKVTITVPATTANLGPGFDCLGLALGLYNEAAFTAEFLSSAGQRPLRPHISATGTDADKTPTDANNLIYASALSVFEKAGRRPSALTLHQENGIPMGSGLGSSASAILLGMLGANALLKRPFTPAQILQFAAEKEGHPDNVAPALYGSLTLSVQADDRLRVERISVPPMKVVIVFPDFELPTKQARQALPSHVPLADAVFNIARAPLLIRALETADYEKLAFAMRDAIHQPYRLPLVPGMAAVFTAMKEAGAAGVALSGAGPSVAAFAPHNHEEIGKTAVAAFTAAGLSSRFWILEVDREGSKTIIAL